MEQHVVAEAFLREIWESLGGEPEVLEAVSFSGNGVLRGYFAYNDLLSAALAASGAAIAELLAAAGAPLPRVHVDRVLTAGWAFALMQPVGPRQPRSWPRRVAGAYPTRDGRWLQITDFYEHHQKAMLEVLGTPPDIDAVAHEVLQHDADALESSLVDAGGTAAASRSASGWARHPAGAAVVGEPIVDIQATGVAGSSWRPIPGRPLAGIRVIDCTRVVAGPMGTRLLAGFGAEVLRIEPPEFEEWPLESLEAIGLTLGKRCAALDLKTPSGRDQFISLLADADLFVHGLRPGVFEALGLGASVRKEVNPGLIEVTHNAYGWTGPWSSRRGFDSIVAVSSGILTESMKRSGASTPAGASIQHVILDNAVGFLNAAAAIRALTSRLSRDVSTQSRLSLARVAWLLISVGAPPVERSITLPLNGPYEERIYMAHHGPVRRLECPFTVDGNPFFWERPDDPFGSATPEWISPSNWWGPEHRSGSLASRADQ